MKNNIKYYRHEVTSHNQREFKALRAKYGWGGEGKFYALKNIIGQEDNCILDINDEINKYTLAADLDFSPEDLEGFLLYLSQVCRLINYHEGILFEYDTAKSLEEFLKERDKDRVRKSKKAPVNFLENETAVDSVRKSSDSDRKTPDSVPETSYNYKDNYNHKEEQKDKEKHNDDDKPEKPAGRFTPPSQVEVLDYFSLNAAGYGWTPDKCAHEAKRFVLFYESKNWYVGKNKMSKWKSAAGGWMERNTTGTGQPGENKAVTSFPSHWSPDFEKKLDVKQLPEYWRHLRSQGLSPVKDNRGNTINWK